MIQDDFLLRQIAQFARGLVNARQQFEVDAEDLDALASLENGAKALSGMSLSTLDRLPVAAIVSGLRANPDRFSERATVLAELLSVAAYHAEQCGDHAVAARRLERADVLLAAVG